MSDRAPAPMFACDGYNIDDGRLASHREITLRADGGPVPREGDAFTILRDAVLADLVVLSVTRSSLSWTARCGLSGRP